MYNSKQTKNRVLVREALKTCERNAKEGEIVREMTDENGNVYGYCGISIIEWARLHRRD